MRLKSFFFIISVFVLFCSCKDYSDLAIKTKEKIFNPFSPSISIALNGKEYIRGELRIKYLNEVLYSGFIESGIEPTFNNYDLDLKKLGENLVVFAADILEDDMVDFTIVFFNQEENIRIEKSPSLKVTKIPVSHIYSIEGTNIESTKNRVYKDELLRAMKTNLPKIEQEKSALLAYAIKNSTKLIEAENDLPDFPLFCEVLELGDKVKVQVVADTAYYRTIIGRYESGSNNESDELLELLESYITDGIDSIRNDFVKILDNGAYLLEREIDILFHSGVNKLYLINIDEQGEYFIQKIGVFLVDNISPKFISSNYGSFNGNPRIEGLVCLNYKHFYGYNPYNVPFEGRAYGDVAKIYVKGQNIPFKTGRDIYFKKKLYLDGGYNRIPIKIVDKRGNVTEDYISITIEQMDDNSIDIHNFHY